MLHACSGIAICVITLGNANMLDTTYAYSCSGESAVGRSAVMEAHTQFRATTALHMLYQGFVPTVATSLQNIGLFTQSQASDIQTFRQNRLAAKLHKLAQLRYTQS